ncbi:hypothetical protein GCM10010397_74650 [Streptomyces spinoverrucosus]|nr:hypothetical protein GCM10010397_74650 [Streptomyces spinoverrucosus]
MAATTAMAALAYARKGPCRGVSARSGWRVNTGELVSDRFRAVPRTDTPRRGPDPHPHRRRYRNHAPTRTGRRRHKTATDEDQPVGPKSETGLTNI